MSYSFYFEDGQGNVMDENGNDPMDITGKEDPYNLEELAREKVMMESRGYKCVYLPPYCPEHNPIEQFWSVVKSSVKREFILKKGTLPAKISEACNSVLPSSFEGFARYSMRRFVDCLNCLPI